MCKTTGVWKQINGELRVKSTLSKLCLKEIVSNLCDKPASTLITRQSVQDLISGSCNISMRIPTRRQLVFTLNLDVVLWKCHILSLSPSPQSYP